VLQVDLFNLTNPNKLSIDIKRQLHIALQALTKLLPNNQNKQLGTFIKRYTDRFGDKEIPLLEALDSESGIGYPDPIDGDSNSLTEAIKLKLADTRNIAISHIENLLFRKLQNSLIQQSYNIDIAPDELDSFNEQMNRLPATFSIMFRVIDFKENKILIETAGAANAVKLLGRFASGDPSINELAQQISKFEKANNPTKIIAEVIHIPNNRLGNILLHPPFFSYEIPYLSHSSLHSENQILVQDIYISILNGTIRLRSKRLNQEIIPVISHAHNTSQSELPVYQFLADLQSQKKNTNLTFSFGQITDELIFTPRITYCKNIVLQPATWRLEKKDCIKLMDKNRYEFITIIKTFVSKWKLPRYVVLEEYDNELFVDFEAIETIEAFLDAIKTKDKIILKEFLFDPNTPVTDENNQPYINQFIATVAQTDPISEQTVIQEIDVLNKPRTFFPGSEWLYYKYYCSAKNADMVLTEIIKPFVSALSKEKLIDSWFFIRYKDDHTHLRVRFHLSDKRKLSTVISAHEKYFQKVTAKELIWRIQIDTYEREIERYGNETIELSEKIFHHDSEAINEFLAIQCKGMQDDDIRWLWGMMSIEELLNDFIYSLDQKFELMNALSNSFHAEFDLLKASKFEIDKKYRKFKTKIDSLFGNTYLDSKFSKIIKKRSKHLSGIRKEINNYNLSDKEVDGLLGSYIHMSLNRLLEHSHRLQEMVIYDFLSRFYKSKMLIEMRSRQELH
jgi:thiopeptide-type bacteriocin biosynthesis protein